jgi:hypothetical protein
VKLSSTDEFAEKTTCAGSALHEWDHEVIKGPRHRLRELQKDLNDAMCGQLCDDVVDKQEKIQIKIVEVGEGPSHAHW